MNNTKGGINIKLNYFLIAFFLLVSFQFSYGQKHHYKDYIIEDFTNAKIAGEISLNKKKFWYTTIYFENKDQGIFEYYYPHQLKGFTKGDSVFVVVRVDSKKFKENGIARRNFALLLNDTSAVKLYKTCITVENGLKEIFFYSKKELKDPVLIEDNKNSVLAAVSNCHSLQKDINQSGYEYSESYFRRLFENYNTCLKDSTATLITVSGNPIQKTDRIAPETSSVAPTSTISPATIVKSDSIYLGDTTTIAPSSNVSEITIAKSDNSTNTSDIVKDNQNSPAPLIEGFAPGDSIIFENYGMYYPGQFLNHTKKGKCSIQYKSMGDKLKTQTVDLQSIYKTTKHPENKDFFGYEVGENANIEVFVTKLNSKVLKSCTIVGLNQNRLVIRYLTEDGKERVLSVDKSMIK